MINFMVQFSYLISVDIEETVIEENMKHEALNKAIEQFANKEFIGMTLTEIASCMAPTYLKDIKKV